MSSRNNNSRNRTHDENYSYTRNNQINDISGGDNDVVQIIGTGSSDDVTNYPIGSNILVPHQVKHLFNIF